MPIFVRVLLIFKPSLLIVKDETKSIFSSLQVPRCKNRIIFQRVKHSKNNKTNTFYYITNVSCYAHKLRRNCDEQMVVKINMRWVEFRVRFLIARMTLIIY